MEKRQIMIKCSSIILVLLLVSACTPSAPVAETPAEPFACDTGGTTENFTLDDASRGYPYPYSLYLPPCYARDTERVYPILYLVPGRGSGPRTWFAAGAGQVADELILSGRVAPFIMVSTETINDDMYAKTILEELVPVIERTYRVSPERRHHLAAGGSLGGIAAYRMAFRFPEQFASAGMFGCGAISGEEEQIKGWLGSMGKEHKTRVFLNIGFEDPQMLERARIMIDLLDDAQIEHEEVFSTGDHTYAYWLSNFPAYLEWAAQDW
jgi:enterochelin esterase-like enzyme